MVRSRPRRTGFFRVLLALLLLTAFASFIVLLSTRYVQVGEVRVPDVVGSNAEDASRALRGLGFEVSTYTDTAATAEPDSVTTQTPAAAAVVRRGRGVALGVSARQSEVVPRVVGLAQAEAATALSEAQLGVGEITFRNAPQPEGVVLEQRPAAAPGALRPELDLVVSLGPKPRQVALPRVVGMQLGAAQQRLQRLGFRRIEAVPTRLGPARVNAQQPRAGVRTEVSAQVTLYYTVANRQVVPVPSVLGLGLQAAAQRLQAAGLRVGPVTTDPFDPTQPSGISRVNPDGYTLWGTAVELRTNGNAGTYRVGAPLLPSQMSPAQNPPRGGTRAALGQTADPLNPRAEQVGQTGQGNTAALPQLPATGGRAIPIAYDPADYSFLQGRAYEFQVEVTDEEGSRVALSRQMGPDEPVEDSVTVYGEAELRMYIDGQIILAYNPPNP